MPLKSLQIGNLFSKIPVVQGGMGVGVSLSGLASAVAAEGGVGVISAAHIGFSLPEFENNPIKANLDALSAHIRAAKERAKGGVIGVNIMTAMRRYDDLVKQSVKSGVDIIFSGAGLPINLPELVKNSTTKIAPIVSSVKSASVLLKMWERRYGATADAVVVEGPDAGGHLGFKPEQLEARTNYDEELTGILSFIKTYEEKFQKHIPVIFGGGVYDKKDVDKYLGMGCEGVQVASRFVATEDCDAHDKFKEAYVCAKEEDIVIVNSPVGMPGRALLNNFIRAVRREKQKIIKCYGCITPCKPAEAPYCISSALIASVKGDTDNGLIFCGAKTHRIDKVTSVKAIIRELTG